MLLHEMSLLPNIPACNIVPTKNPSIPGPSDNNGQVVNETVNKGEKRVLPEFDPNDKSNDNKTKKNHLN